MFLSETCFQSYNSLMKESNFSILILRFVVFCLCSNSSIQTCGQGQAKYQNNLNFVRDCS